MINKQQKFNLSNSILFQSQEDRFIEVDWSRLIQDTQVIVKVKDRGTTIDTDKMSQLFSKFASKSFEGTGFWLFIAKSIVEDHNGKVWAENNNNINTHRGKVDTFYFTPLTINRQQNVKVIDQ